MNENIYEVEYVFCLPGRTFSSNFLTSWSNTLIYLMQNQISFIYCNFYTPILNYTRNSLIRRFPGDYKDLNSNSVLPFDNRVKCKKIIFIDDDMVWTPEDIEKLIKSDKDIIGGFYKMNINDPRGVLAASQNNESIYDRDIIGKTDPIKLTGIGFGLIAIKQDVFNNIEFPWFGTRETINKDTGNVEIQSDDFYFCEKAIDSGYEIYGDPTIQLGHEKNKTLKIGVYHE